MSSACQAWLNERRAACRMTVRPIRWQDSASWRFKDGRIVHNTGGFFSVAGARSASSIPALDGRVQPIIDQPEIGLLGFLVQEGPEGPEWLVQAKAEPGNVGEVQMAPSVQATRSNFTRLHGGAATPYLEFFSSREGARVVADSLQSEQGSRFLGKYNRNATVVVHGECPQPHSGDWRWMRAAELRAMLARDFAVNTDARSVLLCSGWRLLAGGEPFGRWRGQGGWGEDLLASFEAAAGDEASALDWLERRRAGLELRLDLLPLKAMPGWEIDDSGITRQADGRVLVRPYSVDANSREVEHWDQPLIVGHGEESVLQLCQRRGGVLHFLFRASAEVGFRERLQLGPTWQSDDPTDGHGWGSRMLAAARGGRERHAVLQSDEGGRFFRAVYRYRIVEIAGDADLDLPPERFLALDLGTVSRLLGRQGVFSNEARSALSMLLSEL
jgi:oxidase EvaA